MTFLLKLYKFVAFGTHRRRQVVYFEIWNHHVPTLQGMNYVWVDAVNLSETRNYSIIGSPDRLYQHSYSQVTWF